MVYPMWTGKGCGGAVLTPIKLAESDGAGMRVTVGEVGAFGGGKQ